VQGFRVWGLGFRVPSSDPRWLVQGFRVWGLGFRVPSSDPRWLVQISEQGGMEESEGETDADRRQREGVRQVV